MNVSPTVLGEKPQDDAHEAAIQALVDVTKRRLKRSASPRGDRFAHYLIEGVYAVILAVTVGAWSVLGFVVWLPLLVRTTCVLAGTVFYVSLFRDPARAAQAQENVRFAARFYARGFEHFLGFYRQRGEPETPVGLFEPLTAMTRRQFVVECAWVVSVWMVTVLPLTT